MLNNNEILEKMKVHFPRWMDIRRKIKSSSGGLLLSSVSDEIMNLNSAIKEYKKEFFLNNYIDNEDKILTYLYKINIGNVKIDDLVLINPDYKITDSQEEFYKSEKIAYYNDGVIYFKKEFIDIEYAIDGYRSTLSTEKIHTWNIFDEFAVFVGLRRYQWESNKELVNRILEFSKERTNSSEKGLKHAIISNLANIDPTLTEDDILIERPTPENLVKYYNEFETILDHLNEINRDVYSQKRWDIDTWNFALKSVDYIPHAWDVALKNYANGIGFKDDLEVEIIDNESRTDAILYFYKKKVEAINAYIENNNIREKIKLNLKKYDDDLIPEKIKFEITASEAQKLDSQNIYLKAIENKIGKFNVRLEDVVNDAYLFGIDVEDKAILDSRYKYNLEYSPIDPLKSMIIDYCYLKKDNNHTNLIRYNEQGFTKLGQGIINQKTKRYVTDLYEFSSLTNVSKEIEGFVINDLSKESNMQLNIDECPTEFLYYDYDFEEIPVLLKNIKMVNCFINNGQILGDTITGERYIDVNILANSFSCKVYGPYTIEYNIDNGPIQTLSEDNNDVFKFKTPQFNIPRNMNIKIYLKDSSPKCKITNIYYSKFELVFSTEKGDIQQISGENVLPNQMENVLNISMRTYTGFSPVLKYIYIGKKLSKDDSYKNIQITPEKNSRLLTKYKNCKLTLKVLNKENNQVVEIIEDYKPYKFYTSKNNSAQLELQLEDFSDIDSLESDTGAISTENYGNYVQYLLRLSMDEPIGNICVYGTKNKLIKKQSLSELMFKKGFDYLNNDFYIAKNIEKIIVKDKSTGKLRYTLIYREDVFENYNVSKIDIVNNKNNFIAKFTEINKDDSIKSIILSNQNERYFDYLTFVPNDSNIYKAINESNVIFPFIGDIEIVNTFNNGFDINSKREMFYSVKSLNDKYFVRFTEEDKYELWTTYSLGKNTLGIKRKRIEDAKYNFELITIEDEYLLNSSIDIPRDYILPNKEKIDTRRYIITNNLNIEYSNKYNDHENEDDYNMTENLFPDETMFSKLKYSNVNSIDSITYSQEESSIQLIENKDYILYKKEGIIAWINEDIVENAYTVTINYNINVAKSIIMDLDKLYKKIKYNVNAYELLEKTKLEKVSKDQSIDLDIYASYKKSDLVTVICEKPGFTVDMKDNIVTFKKNVLNNTVAVRTGYFYMDGTEYYLFSNENFDNIEKIDDVYFSNVEKTNKQFILKQPTTNFINNSSLMLNAQGNIYDLKCSDKKVKGISALNVISACDSFNYWSAPGANLSITQGLNGSGIRYSAYENEVGYCYLPISTFLEKQGEYMLSFYLKDKKHKTYLGKERLIKSVNSDFNKQSVIDVIREIKESEIEENIYRTQFYNNNIDKYYLIAEGKNIIDDIIVIEKDKYDVGLHEKNISYLKLDIKENIYVNYATRLFLTDKYGSKFDGTEIKDGKVLNSAYIKWGFTPLKRIETYEDFKKCILNEIDLKQYDNKSVAKTLSSKGKIITNPIYIGNTKTIKNLLFKINDVMFDNMKGFKTTLLTSDNSTSGYKEVSHHLDNIGAINGENLLSYIKLIIEMPSFKVINNIEIFLEYLANDTARPSEMTVLTGEYLTKVLDTQYTANFKIKHLNISELNRDIGNYIFQVRASKENNENTVWTTWKTINLKDNYNDYEDKDIIENGNIINEIVFYNYRYIQFRAILKGEDTSIKINYMDLEVV